MTAVYLFPNFECSITSGITKCLFVVKKNIIFTLYQVIMGTYRKK